VDWIWFAPRGGAYSPNRMVRAAIDRIRDRINKYLGSDPRAKHSLAEFHLVCHYYDALVHNTPIDGIDFGFEQCAAKVGQALSTKYFCLILTKRQRPFELDERIRIMCMAKATCGNPDC
jgi:hypothetical protein